MDASVEQRQAIETGAMDNEISFWKTVQAKLPDVLPLLPIASARQRRPLRRYESHTVKRDIGSHLVVKVKDASKALRATPFHFYLAAVQVLFSKLLDIHDLCIGVTDASRTGDHLADTVGFFLNMLPLFQVTVQLPLEAIRDAENPFDLGLGIYETTEGSRGLQVVAQSCLYDRDAAELVMGAYVNLLDVLSSDTSRMLEQYSMFDAAAMRKGISVGKGLRMTWDWPDTLSKRVDIMIKFHRHSLAIIEPRGALTYGELEGRTRLVASVIQKEEPAKGSRIAVLCQPSADLIVSMLAILRLGHLYVPLDTNLPIERHAATLADCKPAMLLCHHETLESVLCPTTDLSIVNISTLSTRFPATDTTPKDDLSDPVSPAFLFYTSGSTSKPKGIQLNQFGFLNHLALKTSELSLQCETVLQQSSFGFDMSLTQTLCALANGGSLVIVPKASRGYPIAPSKPMMEHGVTLTIATPSEYTILLRHGQSWLRKCTGWTHACMGGEAVTQQLVRAFSELGNPNMQLTNCYGPTETSLAVSSDRFSASTAGEMTEHASVGKVLPNYSAYILDEASSGPVPLGYPGEIWVGGAGVALGYLNLPHLSATKFVHDPFADADDGRGWTRMFKTGDRGRLRADGSLIFMGRNEGDNMVKLRGLRIDGSTWTTWQAPWCKRPATS